MNNIEKIYEKENKSVAKFSKMYFSYLATIMANLDDDAIDNFMNLLEKARQNGKTIFIAGNGGSASTASHIGTDFGCSMFKSHDPELPFRAQPLTDHVSVITAVGNDYGYEFIFTKQLEVQYREGDLLMIITASGNSPNIIEAANWVRKRNGKVLGLLGFDGGKAKDLCDVAIVAETPKGEYGPVEDAHLILNHMFTAWMQLKFMHKE